MPKQDITPSFYALIKCLISLPAFRREIKRMGPMYEAEDNKFGYTIYRLVYDLITGPANYEGGEANNFTRVFIDGLGPNNDYGAYSAFMGLFKRRRGRSKNLNTFSILALIIEYLQLESLPYNQPQATDVLLVRKYYNHKCYQCGQESVLHPDESPVLFFKPIYKLLAKKDDNSGQYSEISPCEIKQSAKTREEYPIDVFLYNEMFSAEFAPEHICGNCSAKNVSLKQSFLARLSDIIIVAFPRRQHLNTSASAGMIMSNVPKYRLKNRPIDLLNEPSFNSTVTAYCPNSVGVLSFESRDVPNDIPPKEPKGQEIDLKPPECITVKLKNGSRQYRLFGQINVANAGAKSARSGSRRKNNCNKSIIINIPDEDGTSQYYRAESAFGCGLKKCGPNEQNDNEPNNGNGIGQGSCGNAEKRPKSDKDGQKSARAQNRAKKKGQVKQYNDLELAIYNIF